MEVWDVYDEYRQITGKIVKRGEKLEPREFHLVVHVCLFNTKEEMLIQKRHPAKDIFPNRWDVTVGGSAHAGETSQEAATRELFEEIGLHLDLSGIRPHITMNFESGFDDFYLIIKDLNISNLQLQVEEVQEVKWANKKEIERMIDTKDFCPYHKEIISMLFAIRNTYGVISDNDGVSLDRIRE